MTELGTFEKILTEIGKALLPLRLAFSSSNDFFAFMLKLGWQAGEIPQPVEDLGTGLETLFAELRKIVGDGLAFNGSVSLDDLSATTNFSTDDILRLKNAVEQIVNGIHDIANAPDAAIPSLLRDDNFKDEFPSQLINFLLIKYLMNYQSSLAFFLRAFGVIKTKYVAPSGNRPSYIDYSIDFSDIPRILEKPSIVLENAFGWGSDNFNYHAFASQVDNLFTRIGIDVFIEEIGRDVASKIEGDLDIPGDPVRKVVKGVIFERARSSGRMAAEIRLLYLPKNGSQKPGFALMPAFNGLLDFKMQLGPDIAVIIKSNLDLQGGVALLVRPNLPIDMVLGFNNSGAPTHAKGSLSISAECKQPGDTPILVFGSPDGTRLQYKKISGTGGINLDAKNAVDVFVELEAKGIEFVFDPSKADGFIGKIFPGDGMNLGFDLALGMSYLRGFYFRGTSNLEIDIPAHIQIGPIELQSLTVGANPQSGKIPINIGANVKAELGPLTAVVENIGLTSTFSFPDRGGNLGPVDLDLDFRPPNGVGLAIDASAVKGGGYLYFDPDKEEYAGALELVFSDFLTLKAIGLITTKMPDNSTGFSLLIIITAEFGNGIQLGLGFTLLGVGGLLGLNRTLRVDPLLAGVRTGAINSVMFPTNVIENAPRIISDLRTFFPPEEGKFLIGPMAKLGWGTPPLISLSLGIIIEIPQGNVTILGVLKVALPTEDAPLIVLQVNFLGRIEFDKQRGFFFASLFESRVLFMTIDGEMGLLVAWGAEANFLVSVGGFHPRFNPPPLPFPSPRRIAVHILNEPNARIGVVGYFGVTSNTVQFGARADMFFGFSDLSIEGHLGFDALIQFSPFYFIVQISASVSLKAFGDGVFSVRLRGALEGPAPWRVNGTACVSLLFFEVCADVDVTWGERRNTTLPPIKVMPLLTAEFEKLENWTAALPNANRLLVSLRKLDTTADLVLHPVGTLRISQRAVPLNLTIDKVGNQKPSDAKKFSLNVITSGLGKKGDWEELFAMAQFLNTDDTTKLTKPAYEPQPGGVELSVEGEQLNSSKLVKRIVRYETVILDTNFKRFAKRFFAFVGSLFNHFLNGSAVTRSVLSHNYEQQLHPFADKIQVPLDTFIVAFNSNNQAFNSEATGFTSEAMAHEFMQQQTLDDPNLADSLHVIPDYEVRRTA